MHPGKLSFYNSNSFPVSPKLSIWATPFRAKSFKEYFRRDFHRLSMSHWVGLVDHPALHQWSRGCHHTKCFSECRFGSDSPMWSHRSAFWDSSYTHNILFYLVWEIRSREQIFSHQFDSFWFLFWNISTDGSDLLRLLKWCPNHQVLDVKKEDQSWIKVQLSKAITECKGKVTILKEGDKSWGAADL